MRPDPRTTAVHGDLAAAGLEGVVAAAQFQETRPMRVVAPVAAIRAHPSESAEQADALLFGETFDVLAERDGLAWGQARRDGYVGYVESRALSNDRPEPTHWVAAIRTFAFDAPSIKSRARGPISLNALVTIEEEAGPLALARDLGWVPKPHLLPIGRFLADPAAVAERFAGAPYLWGGRDSVGLDCSGLVQQALYACGLGCPRDSDQQASLGVPAPSIALRRGDLVFWTRHVGIMLDTRRLIHANAFHMAVTIEPLVEAEARILAAGNGAPVALRRVQMSPAMTR